MYEIEYTGQFKRDYKKCVSRHYDLKLIREVIDIIVSKQPLPAKNKTHRLSGQYRDCWECHIQPDWLLIWKTNDKSNILTLIRTGTHADLF